MTAPQVRYALSGDVNVAYQVIGDGGLDLVLIMGALTNLNVFWDDPAYRRFLERLGEFARVLVFDKRGMGLSDRVETGTLEERMDDVRAVMDAAGSTEAALLGISEGGPLSILFAATYPDRTRALVLCGAEVKEETTPDWPWGENTRADFEQGIAAIHERWGTSGKSIAYFVPSLAGDERAEQWFRRLQVESATPRTAEAFMRMAFEIDIRDVVPSVHVPALILHRTGDQVCHVENARWLAAHMPNARYVELAGGDHVPWFDPDRVIPEIREFLTGSREAEAPDRVLATVLFTDIVRSTELATSLGDNRWRELLDLHHAAVRRELQRFRGREVNTAGDGFLAVFDGPARAIRAARAIIDGVAPLGLSIRAGVHTGEVEELPNGDIRGIAVHLGARVASEADPGEVLISSSVRDLVAGSGLRFEDRGYHHLKGIEEERQLFALAGASA
jgi:class 3 adenylate cyclase